LLAYEFLSRLYETFDNSQKKFNDEYGIIDVLRCLSRNTGPDVIIDMLRTCSYLQVIENYKPLSELIISNYAKPAEDFVTASNLNSSDKAKVFSYGFGAFYYSKKDYINSLTYFDKALSEDSNFISALFTKGAALSNLGRNEEAIEWYDKALKVDNRNVNALFRKGLALSNLGRYEEALNALREAIQFGGKGYIAEAIQEQDFEELRSDSRFKKLIEIL